MGNDLSLVTACISTDTIIYDELIGRHKDVELTSQQWP